METSIQLAAISDGIGPTGDLGAGLVGPSWLLPSAQPHGKDLAELAHGLETKHALCRHSAPSYELDLYTNIRSCVQHMLACIGGVHKRDKAVGEMQPD